MTAQMLILAATLATPASSDRAQAPAASANVSDDRLAAVAAPAAATVEGCVATRREVHGRATNLAERVGLDDRFLLIAARVVKGRAPAGTPPRRGAQPMFALLGFTDEQLKPHVGRRVRIEGSFANATRASDGQDAPEPPGLTATTVRQIRGDCPVLSGEPPTGASR